MKITAQDILEILRAVGTDSPYVSIVSEDEKELDQVVIDGWFDLEKFADEVNKKLKPKTCANGHTVRVVGCVSCVREVQSKG